jgi:hypothetical protein
VADLEPIKENYSDFKGKLESGTTNARIMV